MKISLIVPTYNRAEFLKKALPSFVNQTIDNKDYEILVIDNNSTDNTKHIVENFKKNFQNFRIKYFFEKNQGLHFARNKGISEAQGEIIVFGDDDIVASENWLEKIKQEFLDEKVGIVGGKILPIWNFEPPEWIYDYGTDKIHTVFAYLDLGKDKKNLEKEYVFGCNFAIRKNLALKVGGSPPDTFPKKLNFLSGPGEALMVDRVRCLGYKIVYLPEAVVFYHVDSSRITLNYFIDRYERLAIEDVYTVFRRYKKITATKILLKNALINLFKIYFLQFKNVLRMFLKKKYLPLNKVNPKYFIIIEKKRWQYTILQIFRVLLNPKLYKYIIKDNYL